MWLYTTQVYQHFRGHRCSSAWPKNMVKYAVMWRVRDTSCCSGLFSDHKCFIFLSRAPGLIKHQSKKQWTKHRRSRFFEQCTKFKGLKASVTLLTSVSDCKHHPAHKSLTLCSFAWTCSKRPMNDSDKKTRGILEVETHQYIKWTEGSDGGKAQLSSKE